MGSRVVERPPRQLSTATVAGLLIGVLGIAGLFTLRALTPAMGELNLPNALQDLLTLSYSVIIESLPFVILGIVLSILVQVWVPDAWIIRVLPQNPVLRRMAISFLGMFLPVCECGNVPLARGLVAKGFTVSESMTFLIAAPILNPITIITTHQAFGFDDGILVARLLGGFAIANLIGWIYSRHPDQESLLTSRFAAECRVVDAAAARRSNGRKSVDLFAREAGVIMPALFIGAIIAGIVQVAVPRSVLVSLGSNPLWSILAMMVLAFVISICSNVDAFFILPFAGIFLPGSIATFLILGPIIDIKMLAMMRTTFRTSTLVQLTAVVSLMAALIGLVVNFVA
ncbi:permease [Marisediminicola senii]|uniref:permease n=1 Tax=Marisediminicola senii TaxID=2711233 RepID=UPI0038B3102D